LLEPLLASYQCNYEANLCKHRFAPVYQLVNHNMGSSAASSEHEIRVIVVDGNTYRTTLRVGFDGVEYIGRLWFIDKVDSELAFLDHGAIPAATVEEAVRKARGFSDGELEHRCHRALGEKRRFGRLRRATDEMINQIKYLNRVVISLQSGMLDREGGQQEIQQIQNQILAIVRSLPIHAGVED
jgi:hypothetical protein